MKKVLTALLLLCVAVPAFAAEPVVRVSGAANAVWFDDNAKPSDLELGATGAASLSPHISGVGGVFFGLDQSYARGTAGVRITATDVNDPNFGIGLGIVYQFASESVRPQEWTPNVTIGWVPWPETMPRAIIGAEAGYGLESNLAHVIVAVRYYIGSF